MDGANGRKARRAKEVENHKAICPRRTKVRPNHCPDFIARFTQFPSKIIERPEGHDDLFLGNQSAKRCDSRLPCHIPRPSQGIEHPGNRLSQGCQHGFIAAAHHSDAVARPSVIQEEPKYNGAEQNNGSSPFYKIHSPISRCSENIPGRRHMIRRKLHHKGSGLSRKEFELLQDHAGNQCRANADKECGNRNQRRIFEHCPGKESDDRHFRSAGNKSGGHHRNLPIPFLLNGTGRKNSRHSAAGGNQHGNDALAGEPESAKDPIHNKGHPGHISHILQDAQKDGQNQYLRKESQNRTHSGKNSVHDQSIQPSAHPQSGKDPIQKTGEQLSKQYIVCPVRTDRSNRERQTPHSNGVHQEHNSRKNRNRQDPVCYDPIDPIRQGHAVDRSTFLYCVFHHMANVVISLIRNDTFGIIIHRRFAYRDMLLQMRQQFRTESQFLPNHLVTFKQLDGIPAKAARLHHPFDGFLNMCQCLFHTAGENTGQRSPFPCFGQFYSPSGDFRDALSLQRTDLHCLAAKCLSQLHKVDGIPVFPDKVNHVHGHHYRIPELNQLGGQVEVPLKIGSVNHVQNGIGMLLHQVCTGHRLLRRVRAKGVNPREILKDHMVISLQRAFFLFNGHAGPVSHILFGARQGIEQGGLSAVWISRQGDFDIHGKHPPITIVSRSLSL